MGDVVTRIGYEMGHLTAHFLPNKVGILKFCIADVCAMNRENTVMRGLYMSFEASESSNLMHFVPFPRLGISGALRLLMSYLIVFQLFR